MSENGKKSGISRKTRRSLIIAGLILAALLVFYIIDSEGFHEFIDGPVSDLMGETPGPGGEAYATAEPTDAPAVTPGQSPQPSAEFGGPGLEIYVVDVGQADAIFLRSPSGKTMLIDAAESGSYTDALHAFLTAQNVESIDVVVATHPHSDHIGGMWKVIRDFEIADFYLSPVTHTTSTFEKMLDYLETRDVPTHYAVRGEITEIPWDDDVTVAIISPIDGYEYNDLNDWSVILRVSYGENAIMLTGDAETHAEAIALSTLPAELFSATVLKLGHHGSSTSSGAAFVDAVDPEVVVASVGEGNDYGHPHQETLTWIAERGIPFYRTDLNGTVKIVFYGSGYEITAEK